MLPVSGSTGLAQGPLVMYANSVHPDVGVLMIPWIATARTSDDTDTLADRSLDTCFMRGLKETISLKQATALPWTWRRICFTLKGENLRIRNGTTEFLPLYNQDSNGVHRLAHLLTTAVNSSGNLAIAAQFVDYMFRGRKGVDFDEVIQATVDPARVDVKYDRTISLNNLNSRGKVTVHKLWHSMNANIVYDGDEIGSNEGNIAYSVKSKQGMGDYYVVDMFKPMSGGSVEDTLTFIPQATLYWHER